MNGGDKHSENADYHTGLWAMMAYIQTLTLHPHKAATDLTFSIQYYNLRKRTKLSGE